MLFTTLLILAIIFIINAIIIFKNEYELTTGFTGNTSALILDKYTSWEPSPEEPYKGVSADIFCYFLRLQYTVDGQEYTQSCKVRDDYYLLYRTDTLIDVSYKPQQPEQLSFDGCLLEKKYTGDENETSTLLAIVIFIGNLVLVIIELLLNGMDWERRKVAIFETITLSLLTIACLIWAYNIY